MNIKKQRLNQIAKELSKLETYARLAAKGSDDDDFQVEARVRALKFKLDDWLEEYREMYPAKSKTKAFKAFLGK